jgi:5-methylcytosine-specific restriction endonuclease McrA
MTFKRIKIIRSKCGKAYAYLYLVESYKVNGRKNPKQKIIAYLGKFKELEPFDFKRVFERDNFTCKFCGQKNNLTIDHKIPLSKGGTNYFENMQTLCKSCNCKKGKKIL